jgi:hypothetical protein
MKMDLFLRINGKRIVFPLCQVPHKNDDLLRQAQDKLKGDTTTVFYGIM